MRKILCLVACSLFLFSGCGNQSYFQASGTVSETETGQTETSDETASENNEASGDSDLTQSKGTIFVQVAGAVANPDVYELKAGDRVFQAIEAAGGLLETADDSDINQALELSDGEKIYVYTKEERLLTEEQETGENQEDDGLVDINTASAEELKTLPGIGDSKAALIIEYRQTNGDFSSIEEIKNVSGIGDGIYAKLAPYIKV